MTNTYLRRISSRSKTAQKYVPVVVGWTGVLFVVANLFGAIGSSLIPLVALYSSSLLALYGHHALAMGWYDEETGEDRTGSVKTDSKSDKES